MTHDTFLVGTNLRACDVRPVPDHQTGSHL
jgi:hypothetical protein